MINSDSLLRGCSLSDEKMEQVIQELKKRGYTVKVTPDKCLLVERDTFWAKFGYNTHFGQDVSRMKWPMLLTFGFGAIGILLGASWWFWQKGRLKQEVLSITAGK